MNQDTFQPGGGVPTRRTVTRPLPGVADFKYLVRIGPDPASGPVMVAVHGIAREPSMLLRFLAECADAGNYTLIAPVFNQRSYGDYQRLGRAGLGARADLALNAMLEDARAWLGIRGPVHLFGFSGGAQFAHRFVYANPGVVRSGALASAGWYTPPDAGRRFPWGTRKTRRMPGVEFSAGALLETPSLVMVGALDDARDDALRKLPRVDRTQGLTRIERARWFHETIARRAREHAPHVAHRFALLPNTAHDFAQAVLRGGLARVLFHFCNEAGRAVRLQEIET